MEFFIPNGTDSCTALKKTTHLAVAAHQDDIEFMAYHGILECFMKEDQNFTAVTVTNGSGSPRSGIYSSCSDEHMMSVRKREQKKAATIGEYAAQVFLDASSSEVKNAQNRDIIEQLKEIIIKTKPSVIYTHNLADKHDTHIAVTLRLLTALKELDYKPEKLYGCEVWRGLDWMCDDEKVRFDVSGRANLENALLGVFDSQIAGGKRYDLAVVGRRIANCTFSEAHSVDDSDSVIFAMDLMPLLENGTDIINYTTSYIDHFKQDVTNKIQAMNS